MSERNRFDSERTLIANACRILATRGLVDDILGHVSMRVSESTALVRSRGSNERGLKFTVPSDVLEVRLDGLSTAPVGFSFPNELPLHLATLRANPAINSVVHAHPPAVVAITLTKKPLKPIVGAFNIPALFMARAGIPVHPSSALIRTDARAAAMLESMGEHPVCLLRGHGLTAVGKTVQQAVIAAIHVDKLAKLQLEVLQAGIDPDPIDEDDLSDLPDLGSEFTEGHLWRFYLASLEHDNLLVR